MTYLKLFIYLFIYLDVLEPLFHVSDCSAAESSSAYFFLTDTYA
jgi:hypothetical protein